jgi:Tachylectin
VAPSNPAWAVQPLEGYATSNSVMAGDLAEIHASVLPGTGSIVTVDVFNVTQMTFNRGTRDSRIASQAYTVDYRPAISVAPGQQAMTTATFPAVSYPTPDTASVTGCDWPVAWSWKVPSSAAGVNIVRLQAGEACAYILLVVRPRLSETAGSILCQLPLFTYQAYNPWMGTCLYDPPISDADRGQVSLSRPCQLWDFIIFDLPILTWLEAHYPGQVDYCTSLDLHTDPGLLNPYQLFISCGHDEYWSPQMRDNLAAYVASGRNALFLSGNVCCRPVVLDPTTMVMTRSAEFWWHCGRPEGETTGTSCVQQGPYDPPTGAGNWSEEVPAVGYTVRRPSHWMFDGTGLNEGDILGGASGVIGYETDAAPYTESSGYPLTLGVEGTPLQFGILATADLSTPGPQQWIDAAGFATLGYWTNRGTTMTVASTGWGEGLLGDDPAVEQVTANMINRLLTRLDPVGRTLYGVDNTGKLLFYNDSHGDGTGDVGGDKVIGRGGWDAFKFLAGGGDGILYAVDQTGNLLFYRDWHRDGTGDVGGDDVIGYGGWDAFKFLAGGGDGILYAVDQTGNLLFYRDSNRDGTGNVGRPQIIGRGGWTSLLLLTGSG